MKITKKIVAFALAAVSVASCFSMTACNKDDGGIKFYHTMGQNLRDVLDKYIGKFNELYPDIKIKHEQVGGYDDVRNQIKTELQAGNQPHMAYCYPDHVALYNMSGMVLTLDSFIDSTETYTRADGSTEILGLTQAQKDDFITAYYEEGRQFGDNLMYTMPFSKSTEVLYYNKTFFDKNNLTVPTTWDEMEAVCKKIKEIDSKSVPLGYDSESNWFITMCEQMESPYTSATGNHYLFNNETNKGFVKKFAEWYDKGYVTTQKIYGKYTSGLFIEQSKDKMRSYMSIGSSAGATHQRPEKVDGAYPFEVGIAPIPQYNTAKPKVISQGPSVCIFDKGNEEVAKQCWLFLKYLTTSVEFQAEFSAASGYVPVLKSVKDNEFYKKKLEKADGGDNISFLSAKVCMEQVDAYYVSPAFNGSSDARDQVGTIITSVFAKEKSIDEAFAEAVNKCEYYGPSQT